jgi:Rad3-related DNA helicase
MDARVEKGLIHATYKIASELREILGDNPRIIWHTKEDAKEKYQEFLAAPPESGKILVASGLYEGADLPYDQARWQVLTKIPWPYLGDPAIQWLAGQDPEWYRWETVKTVLQACGRIVRGVDDWGITWIPDKSFERLVFQSEHLLPQWWLDGLMEENQSY